MDMVLDTLDGDCNGKVSGKVAESGFFPDSDPCRRELVKIRFSAPQAPKIWVILEIFIFSSPRWGENGYSAPHLGP